MEIDWGIGLIIIWAILYIGFAIGGYYFEKNAASISITELDRICKKYSPHPFFYDKYGTQDEFLCIKEKIKKPIAAPFSGKTKSGRLQDFEGVGI